MSVRRNLNLGSSQMRAKRRRLFFVRFYIILFFFLIILFSLAILSSHEKVTIKTFLITGNNSILNSEILNIANSNLKGRYFGLFARSNTFIFPRFKIAEDIAEQNKIVENVNLSWKDFQTVGIAITERKPHSAWCGNDVSDKEATCYFIDKDGYVFSQSPVFSGNIFIKNYGNIAEADPLGNYFLPTELYNKIFSLIEILDKRGMAIRAVYFDKIDFRFYLTSGQTIIFNDKNGGFDTAFQNLFAAVESKDLDLVKDGAKISYIDLRFESKIVVGKNETTE